MSISHHRREEINTLDHPLTPGHRNTAGNTAFAINPEVSALPVPEKGIHRRDMDVEDLLDVIHLSLKGYQSYFLHVNENEPWTVTFPFAWKLNIGDKVFNLTKNAVYTIEAYADKQTNQVVVLKSGSGAPAPDKEDILELDFDNSTTVNFQHAYPDSDDVNRFFTDEQILKNSSEPLVDTIVYNYSIKPFERERPSRQIDSKPRAIAQINKSLREQIISKETGEIKNVFGTLYKVGLCFTCWTATQERSSLLAKWFRIFMRRYQSNLIVNGLHQIWFEEQEKSLNINRWRNDIIGRTMHFSAVIEEQWIESDPMLRSIEAYLSVSKGRDAQSLELSTDIEKQGGQ